MTNFDFEVLTAVSVKSTAYWVVTLYNSRSSTFRRTVSHSSSESESKLNLYASRAACLFLLFYLAYFSTLKMKTIKSSEIPVSSIERTTWPQNPEDQLFRPANHFSGDHEVTI
jgi:hypothetical protein